MSSRKMTDIAQIKLLQMYYPTLIQILLWLKPTFVCIASELLTDRQAPETPTAVYSWDEQRGKPVLPGLIYPSSLMEPTTTFEQPSDCLTLNFHIETQHQSAAQ